MKNRIQRVLVADVAGRLDRTAQMTSGGLAAELKRLRSTVHFRWYSKTGKDISKYSHNPDELEILTAPNTSFKVDDIAAIPKPEQHLIDSKELMDLTGMNADEVAPLRRRSGVSLWIGMKEL